VKQRRSENNSHKHKKTAIAISSVWRREMCERKTNMERGVKWGEVALKQRYERKKESVKSKG
jgi:hypothetical protein